VSKSTEHILKIRIKGDSAEIVGASKDAADGVERVGDESDRTASRLNHLEKAQDRAANSGHRLTGTYSRLRGILAGVGVGFAAMKMVDTIGQTQTLNIQLQELTDSSQAFALNQEYLQETARRLRKEYFTLGSGYAKLLALQKGGVTTQKESRQLLEGLTDTSAALGASNNQLGQSLFGLSQGLSQSVLRAEEFNQVVEPLPGLMQAIDKAAGLSAGGFRELVNQQKVTSEFFKETLIKAFEEFEGAAERAGQTIPGALTDISNAYTEIAGLLEAPVSATLVPVLESVASGLRALPEFADEAQLLLTVLTSYAAVRFIPPLLTSMTTRAYAAAKGFTAAGHGVDIYGAKLKTATVTTRVFNTALAALGGPLGIVSTLLIAGAFEILTYKSASEEAIEATRNWGKEIEKTQSIFERFIETQKAASRSTVNAQDLDAAKVRYSEVATEIEKVTIQLARLEARNASLGRQEKARLALVKLKAELVELERVLGAAASAPKKAVEALEKLSTSLDSQLALFGKSKQEARLFNVEQAILAERAKLGTQATEAQILSFERFAAKARESASALGELEKAQIALKELEKGNRETAKVVDFSAARAAQLETEAQNYAASAALRENAHQQRLAQIKGHITDEVLFQQQQYDLENQLELQRYAQQQSLAEQKFVESEAKLAERRQLAFENKLISQEEQAAILFEIDVQQEQLELARRQQKEAAAQIHEQRMTDIKRRQIELRAQLEEQQRQRDLQGASQFFGNLATLSQAGSKKLFKISQVAAIGQTIVNTYAAAQRAMAEISYPLNIAVAASQMVAGFVRVKQIRSQTFGNTGASAGSSSPSISGASAPSAPNNVVPFTPAPRPLAPTANDGLAQHNESNFQSGQLAITVNLEGANFHGNDSLRQAEEVKATLENLSFDPNSRLAQSLKNEVVNG